MALRRRDLTVGLSHEAIIVEDLTRTQLVMYAGASGDYNPVHHDEVYATRVAGFPTVFAPGMLTMGMTGRALTDWVGDGQLTTFGVRFRNQVWPGDTLHATITVRELDDTEGDLAVHLDVLTRNQEGEVVLEGKASARIEA